MNYKDMFNIYIIITTHIVHYDENTLPAVRATSFLH